MDATSRDDFKTYGGLILVFIIVSILSVAGMLNSQMTGLLVPLCVYAIMAISLNLVVGILGELSIGHAGFMCVGAFASAFFSKVTVGSMPDLLRFIIAIIIGGIVAGIFGFLIGIPVLRLRGDYLARSSRILLMFSMSAGMQTASISPSRAQTISVWI